MQRDQLRKLGATAFTRHKQPARFNWTRLPSASGQRSVNDFRGSSNLTHLGRTDPRPAGQHRAASAAQRLQALPPGVHCVAATSGCCCSRAQVGGTCATPSFPQLLTQSSGELNPHSGARGSGGSTKVFLGLGGIRDIIRGYIASQQFQQHSIREAINLK